MRFWDSSAVVTLLFEQTLRAHAVELLAVDAEMIVWWGTSVECASAIGRVEREGGLTEYAISAATDRLRDLSTAWYEVAPVEEVRLQAMRLLRTHPLRAADALQLAAALVWSGHSEQLELVSFDERLCTAARREGFIA